MIMATPVCKSSHEMRMLFTFFKGEGCEITLVVLQELMGILTETLGLPLPEGMSSFLPLKIYMKLPIQMEYLMSLLLSPYFL